MIRKVLVPLKILTINLGIRVHFTREPVIETIITPREGFKLVIRNSKGVGQEEFYVDSVEIISFGQSLFFRSLEKPKVFLLPVSDYDILELRDTRVVLKYPSVDRSVKIGTKEKIKEKKTSKQEKPVEIQEDVQEPSDKIEITSESSQAELVLDKKRERRKHVRRRRLQDDKATEENVAESNKNEKKEPLIDDNEKGGDKNDETKDVSSSQIQRKILPPPKILQPPKTLIFNKMAANKKQEDSKEAILDDNLKKDEIKVEVATDRKKPLAETIISSSKIEDESIEKTAGDFVSILEQKVAANKEGKGKLSSFYSILEEEFDQ